MGYQADATTTIRVTSNFTQRVYIYVVVFKERPLTDEEYLQHHPRIVKKVQFQIQSVLSQDSL